MQAAVFEGPGAITVVERPVPAPGPGEVLVRVHAAGLCAGDMYSYKGTNPYIVLPRVGGHEIAGEIAAVGPDSTALPVGTQVVIDPFLGCGTCYPCRIGKYNCCANLKIIGIHRDGGFADYLTAPAEKVIAVPAGMEPYLAAFAEPVAIGVQSCRRGMISQDDTVLVLGAGPIGLSLVEVARARGARVLVTDISSERLATAAALGGEPLPAGEGLMEAVLRETNGEGMPVVIEATGNAAAMESTIELVANGGRIVIVGLVAKGKIIGFPGLDFTRKEVTIVGSRASANCFEESLSLIASGAIRYPTIGSRFPLAQAPDVMARLAAEPGAYHKAVFMTG